MSTAPMYSAHSKALGSGQLCWLMLILSSSIDSYSFSSIHWMLSHIPVLGMAFGLASLAGRY